MGFRPIAQDASIYIAIVSPKKEIRAIGEGRKTLSKFLMNKIEEGLNPKPTAAPEMPAPTW
jgi:hypothetical protein